MKYKLPGIYLGNISLDLFMEYMQSEDLSDQTSSNSYYLTNNRTENIKVFRVDFSFDDEDLVLYAYNIRDLSKVRETIRTYFRDIIKDDSDPSFDYDNVIDSLDITVRTDIFYDNPVLFDTLGEPSVYGPHMMDSNGNNIYMISVEGSSGQILGNRQAILDYAQDENTLQPPEVSIYDMRYETKRLIKNLYVDVNAIGEYTTTLIEQILNIDETEIVNLKENRLSYGTKSMLNLIKNNFFYYRDRFGGLTRVSNRNVVMQDIINNRTLMTNSIREKMLRSIYSSHFKGRAGIVRTNSSSNSLVDIIFSKYDQYNIIKNFEEVESIPDGIEDVRFEDIEPDLINRISLSESSTYEIEDSRMIVYTNLINTSNLPKFKAIYNNVGTDHRYYIFDIDRGNVPEFIDEDGVISEPKTLCLLDVYKNPRISVRGAVSERKHNLIYNVSNDGISIFRTINVNSKTYYIKMSNDENELTASVIIPSNTTNIFTSANDLINDFSFSDIGLSVSTGDVYPTSYSTDGSNNLVVEG
jgi:hypothetical protein